MDYKGIKCPVCDKPFTENDDIVVCPVCGAPYHRGCYKEKGACIFTDLHESGKTWAPPVPPDAPNTASELKDKECPNCGTLNAHSALFCNICGTSLTGAPDEHRNTGYNTQQNPNNANNPNSYNNYNNPYGSYPPPQNNANYQSRGFGGVPFAFDPMGGANPAEFVADNVTYGDVSKVVQQNTAYYLSVFRNIKSFGRSKFNFSAFLFSGGWLLYRKQYKAGIITTTIMFLLYIANLMLSCFVVNPITTHVIDNAGVSSSDLSYVQLANLLSQYLMDNPSQYLLFCLPLLCSALMLGIMIFVGVRANRMYLNHCVRTVQEIKSVSNTETDLSAEYTARGGVNVVVTFCLLACYMILRWIPLFLT